MSEYLLDTHVFLWFFAEPTRLSARTREVLQDDSHSLRLSVVSVWELGLKHALGKLRLPEPPRDYVAQRCRAARIHLVPIMPTHSFRMIELPFHHRDLFDRMIVAQALEEGWTVLTHDQVIPSYGVSCMC